MNLYRVIVLQERENLERGVWADKVEIQETSLVFLKYDEGIDGTIIRQLITAVYPAKLTVITNVETKEEYDRRKGTI